LQFSKLVLSNLSFSPKDEASDSRFSMTAFVLKSFKQSCSAQPEHIELMETFGGMVNNCTRIGLGYCGRLEVANVIASGVQLFM
jgi:hypothetical protein